MAGRQRRASWRKAHWLLVLACLLPPAAHAQISNLEQYLTAVRDDGRFVPARALQRLQEVETQARSAPLPIRAEFLTQLSNARMRLGQNDIAMQLAEELIAYARQNKSDVALAKGMLNKAYITFARNERRASHLLAFEAEKIANRTDDLTVRVQATISAGQSWAEEGNFPFALAKLQAAVDLARQSKSPSSLAAALNALTLLYTQMREYDKGFEVLDELLAVSSTLASPGRWRRRRIRNTGWRSTRSSRGGASAPCWRPWRWNASWGARGMVAVTLVNLSDSYLKEGDYAQTLRYANEAITAARLVNDEQVEATARLNIGQALIGQGRLQEGKQSVATGLAYYERTANQPEMQAVLLEYGMALEKAGDLRGAVTAYHRERGISNQLFEKQRQKAVYELQEKYEAEKKQRQIELLSRENQLKSTEIDNRRCSSACGGCWRVLPWRPPLSACCTARCATQRAAQGENRNSSARVRATSDGLYNRRLSRNHAQPCGQAAASMPAAMSWARCSCSTSTIQAHQRRLRPCGGRPGADDDRRTLHDVFARTDMIVRWGARNSSPSCRRRARGLDDIARASSTAWKHKSSITRGKPSRCMCPSALRPIRWRRWDGRSRGNAAST